MRSDCLFIEGFEAFAADALAGAYSVAAILSCCGVGPRILEVALGTSSSICVKPVSLLPVVDTLVCLT